MGMTEHRRLTRRGKSSSEMDNLDNAERFAMGKVLNDANRKRRSQPRRRGRQLRWWERHELSDLSLLLCCLGFSIVIYSVRNRAVDSSRYPSLKYVSKEFAALYYKTRQPVLSNKLIYDSIYNLAKERLRPPDETNWPAYQRHVYSLNHEYGQDIKHCSVTALILEQNLGKPTYDFGPGQSLWFELESLAAFLPEDSCISLQTTTCSMATYLGDKASTEVVQQEISKMIYDSSLPLFRQKIEMGRVRITFLDYHKFNVNVCDDMDNQSVVLLNHRYWTNYFSDIDSDTVLVHQAGTTMCYPLTDLENMRGYALVGSLWPKGHHSRVLEPIEGACRGMSIRWKQWLHPQRRWQAQQENPDLMMKQHRATKPKELLSVDFPSICENGLGPIGHGTWSLRSRRWMIRAIESCPHVQYSGLPTDSEPFACKVFDSIDHDFYFGVVLAGIGAPLPSASEASLFSLEIMWPDDAWLVYGGITDRDHPIAPSRPTIVFEGEERVIPNAIVQPWLHHPVEILKSEAMTNACPFLPYTIMSHLQLANSENDAEILEQKEWHGVGH